jgi:hypothetical protein
MFRAKLLLILLLFAMLTVTRTVQAEEGKLSATFDPTYLSRWLSKGSEVWSEDGDIFEIITLDLWSTGFGVGVTHLSATGGGIPFTKLSLKYEF